MAKKKNKKKFSKKRCIKKLKKLKKKFLKKKFLKKVPKDLFSLKNITYVFAGLGILIFIFSITVYGYFTYKLKKGDLKSMGEKSMIMPQ